MGLIDGLNNAVSTVKSTITEQVSEAQEKITSIFESDDVDNTDTQSGYSSFAERKRNLDEELNKLLDELTKLSEENSDTEE